MKTRIEKKFDSVKMMMEIRDKISKDTENMDFKEFKKYLDSKLNSQNSKSSVK